MHLIRLTVKTRETYPFFSPNIWCIHSEAKNGKYKGLRLSLNDKIQAILGISKTQLGSTRWFSLHSSFFQNYSVNSTNLNAICASIDVESWLPTLIWMVPKSSKCSNPNASFLGEHPCHRGFRPLGIHKLDRWWRE